MMQTVYYVDAPDSCNKVKIVSPPQQQQSIRQDPADQLTLLERILNLFKSGDEKNFSAYRIGGFLFAVLLVVCAAIVLIVLGALGKLTYQKASHHINATQFSIGATKIQNASLNTCGYSAYLTSSMNINANSRIIKGSMASPSSMPWIVSLRLTTQISSHFCGGSLISSQHVVTAAHCVYDKEPTSIAVIIGLYDLNSFSSSNIFYVQEAFVHENYRYNVINDIAVLKLSEAFVQTNLINPICLTSNDANIYGTNLIVAGWGNVNAGYKINLPEYLQQTELKVINGDARCSQSRLWSFGSNTMLCAIDENSQIGSNVCLGKTKKLKSCINLYKHIFKW